MTASPDPTADLTPAQRSEVELLARGKAERSRVIREAKLNETPEVAHEFLLRRKVWDELRVPYADRAGIDLSDVELPIPALPDEPRLDLTHLSAYAIDDEGSLDPDDAISLEEIKLEGGAPGWRLWVHVADVAALIEPNSPLDMAARARGATLYLPGRIYSMVPDAVVQQLGLGLHETSPALSISIDFDTEWNAETVDVQLTRVRAERLTYSAAQERLDAGDELLTSLQHLARASQKQREAEGAIRIDLPEVRVKLLDADSGTDIQIKAVPRPETRFIVQECMTLAGWAAAIYADDLDIALPFATQDAPTREVRGDDLPAHWARRKTLARTRFRPSIGAHHGMGLDAYAQATSPMRRYLDLVVHQQLRAAMKNEPGLSGGDIAARVAQAEMNALGTRTAERQTRRHYTLAMLMRRPEEVWDAQVVERRGPQATVMISELALDALMSTAAQVGDFLRVQPAQVDLPNLSVRLREIRE